MLLENTVCAPPVLVIEMEQREVNSNNSVRQRTHGTGFSLDVL